MLLPSQQLQLHGSCTPESMHAPHNHPGSCMPESLYVPHHHHGSCSCMQLRASYPPSWQLRASYPSYPCVPHTVIPLIPYHACAPCGPARRGQPADSWWSRLFRHHADVAWDDYEKDYSDLPAAMREVQMLEAAKG